MLSVSRALFIFEIKSLHIYVHPVAFYQRSYTHSKTNKSKSSDENGCYKDLNCAVMLVTNTDLIEEVNAALSHMVLLVVITEMICLLFLHAFSA